MIAISTCTKRLAVAAGLIAMSVYAAPSAAVAAEAMGEPIKIPFLQTFSGAAAGYGEVMMNGAVLGVEVVNKQLGGIKGRPIELVPYDAPFTDMPAAVTMFKKLARDPDVPVLLGISATAILAAVHDQIEQFKIPVFAYDSGGNWRPRQVQSLCLAGDSAGANGGAGADAEDAEEVQHQESGLDVQQR